MAPETHARARSDPTGDHPMSDALRPRRSVLYMPGANERALEKAKGLPADALILDLEDAVAPAARPSARTALVENPLDPSRVIVRVNPAGSDDFAADLEAVTRAGYRTVMVAKADAGLPPLPGVDVIALCETARGVLDAPALAQREGVVALMWGAEDLIASLGGTSSRDLRGGYREVVRHARAHVLLAAGAAGIAAIDAVHLAIADLDGLRAEAEDAVASGFAATACIHPTHAAVIRDAYRPSAAEVAQAARVLEAAAAQDGVFRLEGLMVDGPVLRHAEAVIRRSQIV
jgi:citrate lyase subunit beta/citryl-CoA lyase